MRASGKYCPADAGSRVLLAAVPAVLQAGRLRTPGAMQWLVLAFYLWLCCSLLLVDCAGRDSWKRCGVLPRDDDCLAGVGVCGEPGGYAGLLRGYVAGSWVLAVLTLWSFASRRCGGRRFGLWRKGRTRTIWPAIWIWDCRWRRCF